MYENQSLLAKTNDHTRLSARLSTMVPVFKKFTTSFSLSIRNFYFHLVSCENFQSLVTFNEISESVDGLQIENRKNFENIIFRSKVIAI